MPQKKQNTPQEPTRKSRRQAGDAPKPVDEEVLSSRRRGQSSKKPETDTNKSPPPATKTKNGNTKTLTKSRKGQSFKSIGKRRRGENQEESEEEIEFRPHRIARGNAGDTTFAFSRSQPVNWKSPLRHKTKKTKTSRRRAEDSHAPEWADIPLDDYSEDDSGEQTNNEDQEEEDSQSERSISMSSSSDSESSDPESGSEEPSQVDGDVSTRMKWGWESQKARTKYPIVVRQQRRLRTGIISISDSTRTARKRFLFKV